MREHDGNVVVGGHCCDHPGRAVDAEPADGKKQSTQRRVFALREEVHVQPVGHQWTGKNDEVEGSQRADVHVDRFGVVARSSEDDENKYVSYQSSEQGKRFGVQHDETRHFVCRLLTVAVKTAGVDGGCVPISHDTGRHVSPHTLCDQ